MTIKVGGEGSDYSFDTFVQQVREGMSFEVENPISFDATARGHMLYEKVKEMLQGAGIQVDEVRSHATQRVEEAPAPAPFPFPEAEETQPARHRLEDQQPAPAALLEENEPAYSQEYAPPKPDLDEEEARGFDVPIELEGLLKDVANSDPDPTAKVYTFGSSKGGTGKTFTCVTSARRYAQTHPNERVALIDMDIIDAQVGVSLHYTQPNVNNAYLSWVGSQEQMDLTSSFRTIDALGSNLHVYAGSSSGLEKDRFPDNFWIDFLVRIVNEYDAVFIDTGIDYLNIEPIRMAYRIADRIIIMSGTSIKSITSVKKQLTFLAGLHRDSPYTADMELIGKVGLVFTQWEANNALDQAPNLVKSMTKIGNITVPVLVKFGYVRFIQEIEFLGNWELADNKRFQQGFDKILD